MSNLRQFVYNSPYPDPWRGRSRTAPPDSASGGVLGSGDEFPNYDSLGASSRNSLLKAPGPPWEARTMKNIWKITIHACCHLRTVLSHGLNVPNHDGELRLQNCLPNALNMKYDKEQKYNKPHTNKNIRKNLHVPNIVGSIQYIYIK